MKSLLHTFKKRSPMAFALPQWVLLGGLILELSAVACQSSEKSKQDAKSLFNILTSNEFKIVRRVSNLPTDVLLAARAIPSSRKLESIMVDPGRHYQDQHSGIDFSKPTTQLVFGAVAERYLLVCYWVGGVTKAEHLVLVRHDSDRASVVAKGVVHPPAETFAELKDRLKVNDYVPFDLQSTYIVPSVPD